MLSKINFKILVRYFISLQKLFSVHKSSQLAISTGQPRTCLHPPINEWLYGLKEELVLRWVSHLDAFSGYPVHTATRHRMAHNRYTSGMFIPLH